MLNFAVISLLLLYTLENVPRIKMQTVSISILNAAWFILILMFLSMKDTSQT